MGFWCQNRYLLPGCKKFKQNAEKRLPAQGAGCYFCEKSGVLASCAWGGGVRDAGYLGCEGVGE